jgi:hypothetical protein
MKLGRHGKISADEARKSAHRLFGSIRDGKDPLAERRAFIDAPIVGDLLDRYVAEHVEKRNHSYEDLRSAQMRQLWALVLAGGLALAISPWWFIIIVHATDGGSGP